MLDGLISFDDIWRAARAAKADLALVRKLIVEAGPTLSRLMS